MQINRREFLERSLAIGAAASLPMNSVAADAKAIRRASDVIELGPTKVKASRMAVGTGTYGAGRSSNQLRDLGVDGVADMLKKAYDKGVFLFDTADAYGTHDAIKVALKTLPREKITIMTKTDARTAEKTKADIDRFLQEMGTDYIDILLLHTRMSPNWDEVDKGGMEAMSAAKEKKTIRAVGLSCHSVEAMKLSVKSPWLDICMVRINPAGERMDDSPEAVLPVMAELKAAGKGIVGIKVLGEGTLLDGGHNDALKFALTKSPAHCFSIGCESFEQVQDNIDRIEKLAVPA
jgi:aryl-alcohol dehydrogenase-like predicted oxidoreductase